MPREMLLVVCVFIFLAIAFRVVQGQEEAEQARKLAKAMICAGTPMEKGCPEREKLELENELTERALERANAEAEHRRIHDLYH